MEHQGRGFGYLPDNLLEEILSRCSVKTLVKLLCVSKHWKSLISNPIFKSIHHKNTIKNPPSLLMFTYDPYTRVLLTTFNLSGEFLDRWDVPFRELLMTGDGKRILPSQSQFNKLLCLTDTNRFFMCNPSTRRLIPLPPLYTVKSCLVCYGGFAFLPSSDEYVIVQLTSDTSCHILTLSISNKDKLIYSNWKRVETNFYDDSEFSHPWGIFVNGFFYWAMDTLANRLLSFDMEKETFAFVDLPMGIDEIKDGIVSVVELKGDLYMRFVRPERLTTELWKLNSNDKKWSKHCSVYMDNQRYSLVGSIPVYMNGEGEILFIMGEDLKYYNPENKTFRRIGKSEVWYIGDLVLHTDNMFLLGN